MLAFSAIMLNSYFVALFAGVFGTFYGVCRPVATYLPQVLLLVVFVRFSLIAVSLKPNICF